MASSKAVRSFADLLEDAKTRKRFDKTTLEPLVSRRGELSKGEQRFIWDPLNPGFGVKITPDKAVYLIERRMPDGTKVRYVLDNYRAMTIEQAQHLAQDVFKKMREGINPVAEKKRAKVVANDEKAANSLTLRFVLNDYLARYNDRLRTKTKDVYRTAVERCFGDGAFRNKDGSLKKKKNGEIIRGPIWQSWLDIPMADIDENMVADRQLAISSASGPRGKGEAAANQAMRVLRTLFNFAMETYKDSDKTAVITSNPVLTLKARRLWNKNVAREDVLEDDQLAAWYQAVTQLENETTRDLLLVCLFTGLRRSEACKLKWERVRLSGDKPILVIPKEDTKIGVEHRLPLSDFVLELLKNRDRVRKIGNPYVFPGEKPGSHLVEPKGVIAKVIDESKIDFSCHTLRRTFGTVAARLDISYAKHKKLMAHSTKGDVTSHHYTRLTEEDLREPMQKIADYIKQHAGINSHQSPETSLA